MGNEQEPERGRGERRWVVSPPHSSPWAGSLAGLAWPSDSPWLSWLQPLPCPHLPVIWQGVPTTSQEAGSGCGICLRRGVGGQGPWDPSLWRNVSNRPERGSPTLLL